MPIDTRTPPVVAVDDAALAFLEGTHGGMADAIDVDSLYRLAALELAIPMDSGRARFVTEAGRRYLALMRVVGDAPRGILTVTATASGASFHYWPDGLGRRRILAARYRTATRLLDYTPACNPIGTSGRAEASTLVDAHAYVSRRCLELEADAAARYVAPFTVD